MAVTLYVQDDPDAVAVLIANNQVDDELQGLKGLASASDQKAGIFAFQVDYGSTGLRVVGGPYRPADVDLGGLQDPAYRLNGDGGSIA